MAAYIEGLLELDELARRVDAGEIDNVVVGFTDQYGKLCGKRFDAAFFCESVAKDGTHACDYLLTNDMELEPVPGYKFASWDLGYGDVHMVPDLATLRVAAWQNATALVLCDVVDQRTHELARIAPRSILRAQIDRAASAGYLAKAGTELEYYLYRTPYRDAASSDYVDLEPAGWYLEDYQLLQGTRTEDFHAAVRRALTNSGVPVESSKGEWGLGQHELNVRYAEALEMADRHVVYKQCLKEVAQSQGVSVTFMAKPHADRAGSSCHVHISLWRDDVSAFADGPDLEHFVAGCLNHIGALMPFLAPTINSYKRYVDGSWAPTRIAWSDDNRTGGFRVVGDGPGRRIECRIPGADANPYIALAAILAAGLDGIERRSEAPPPFAGDLYAATELPHVARTLRDATDAFAGSAFARATFGDDVVDHYTHFFRTEQAAFDATVTDWERRRYFERI